MKKEHEQFKGRKVMFSSFEGSELAFFEDQFHDSFICSGRGKTKEDMTTDLYENELKRLSQ